MNKKIGYIGLGKMGKNMVLRLLDHKWNVTAYNRSPESVKEMESKGAKGAYSLKEVVGGLESPRLIWLMVPHQAVDSVLEELVPILESGDVVIDGGNSNYKESVRRAKELKEKNIKFLDAGVSGGPAGARDGACTMVGGEKEDFENYEELFKDISAPNAYAYMGRAGAGHFVKMVHNGIEYAEMQMLAEAYHLLKTLYKISNEEIADIFEEWSSGRMGSFLTEISIDVLRKEEDGQPLLDLILDKAKQKGTGQWTSQEALALGVPTASITGAVFMRALSSDKETRTELAKIYPIQDQAPQMLLSEFAGHLEKALYASRISNFEQGMALLREADKIHKFGLNFPEIIRVWQGGCIIRCQILKELHKAIKEKNQSFYFSDFAHKAIVDAQKSWRLVVNAGVNHSVPLMAISTALTHFETYRQARGSANFIQGLRDCFGAHTYERIDKEGTFHSDWS